MPVTKRVVMQSGRAIIDVNVRYFNVAASSRQEALAHTKMTFLLMLGVFSAARTSMMETRCVGKGKRAARRFGMIRAGGGASA
jgi:hypothetical protein